MEVAGLSRCWGRRCNALGTDRGGHSLVDCRHGLGDMGRNAVADRYSLGDRASGVRCVYAISISSRSMQVKFPTYITVVTTSNVWADTVAAGVGGATHLVQIVEVYVL